MKAIISTVVLFLFGLLGPVRADNDEAPESGPIVPAPHWGPPAAPTPTHSGVKIEDVRTISSSPRPAVDFFDPRLSRTPPILVDPNHYETENNWLACVIARRLVDFALLIRHEDALKGAAIKITANVDAAQRKVHLEIQIPSQPAVTIDLQPDFAWDGHGYAPLATVLMAHAPTELPAGEPLPDLLRDLQNLTGPQLAAKDVELSRLLQKHPAWAAAHEEAVLLLVALALRDNAGDYSDSRRMLCRATAHLALAEVLRGADAQTWAGRIADAGIRALSGREIDALTHLDSLATDASGPAAAKPWIDAFRLRAKDDWRVVTPDASAPLLTKIAYFRTLQDKLTPLPALKRFEPLGDLASVTDWGHAVMANTLGAWVQTSNQFDQATFNLELDELGKVLASEGSSFDPVHAPGKQLSQPLVEQLYSGPNGELRVIGPDMFKDFARRHLLLDMIQTRQWLENLLGLPDDAEIFRKTMWSNFQGMRMMEVTYDFAKESEHKTPEEQVVAEGVKWYPWEIAAGDLSNSFANARDQVAAGQFYKDGLPFGTAYNLAVRARTLEDGAVGRPEIPHENPRALVTDYLENSPYLHEHPFGGDALQRMILGPHAPTQIYPPVADLRSLTPDSFELFAYNRPLADLIASSRPWWDYDLAAIYKIEHYKALLDDATLGELLRKHAALEPDAYFQLGQELRAEGKTDEAAEADRKGFDEGYDEVGKANFIGPLVNYYFDHGRRDEAIQVAKAAAATYSEVGLMTYCNLLEKMGRLSEAADCAEAIYKRYNDHAMLDRLFAAHPDTFADQNVQLVANRFPQGLAKADFASFQGPPKTGCRIVDDSEFLEQAGLQPGDIIVAMDGIRVDNEPQYRYLRDRSRDPHMDLIIWRGSRYLNAHVSAPDRRFLVRIETYPSPPPQRP